MAKLKSKKGNITNCNILNESYDSYIVEINGKVGPVKKDRIIELNTIDEAVLDRIRQGAKKLIDKVKAAVYKLFVKNNRITAFNDEGDLIPVSVPLNWGLVSQNNENRGYFPSENDIKLAKDLGLELNYDARVPSDKKGIMYSYDEYLKELNKPIGESAQDYAKSLNHVYPHALGDERPGKGSVTDEMKYIPDRDYEDIIDDIIDQYYALRQGDRSHDVLCLWGPPGIGKTALLTEVQERLKQEGFNIGICSISGNSRPDMSLYMQGKKDINYTSQSGDTHIDSVWVSNPMFGIPAYANAGLSEKDRMDADIYANGGRYKREDDGTITCIAKPDGGIFFIDEFSRSNEVMLNEFMQMFADAKFGSNLVVGSRWLLVLAANRKMDMENTNAADTFKMDAAQSSRIQSVNVIVNPDTWLKWAKREETDNSKRDINADYYTKDNDTAETRTKILPEIIDFITGAKDQLYDLQIYDETMPEFVNQHAAKATPRGWHNVSLALRAKMASASRRLHKPIESITDLINSGYHGYDNLDAIINIVATHVGTPAAEKFRIFLQNQVFSTAEIKEIWTNGKTNIKAIPFATLKDFAIPRLVNANPYAADEANKTFEEVIPPQGLLNVIEFLYNMASRATGLNSAKESGVMAFNKAWGFFQDACVKNYKCMEGLGFEDNISKLPVDIQEQYRDAIIRKEVLAGKNVKKI